MGISHKLGSEELIADENSRVAVLECVVWLAQNCCTYKPEYLAGVMADDLLGEKKPKKTT